MSSPFPRPHPLDGFIAVTGLLSGLLLWAVGLHSQAGRPLGGAWVLLPLVVTAALELLRRSRPRAALCGGIAAAVADQFTAGSLATLLMFTDLMYAAVVYGTAASARRIPVVTGLFSLALTIGLLAWWRDPQALLVGVVTGLVTFGPATTGAILRNHRDAAEAARLRAEQTALLAEVDRVQAVNAERARMARELHDMVAGHLSAIAIHSTAALSLDDPATTRDALTVIRENSVEGLAEMRRLIGILRDPGDGPEPAAAPGLDGLGALVDGARSNGLDVRLQDDRPDSARLPAPVELAAYRIVQESLTNALKHASPGPVLVRLGFGEGALAIRVTSPCGHRAGPRAPGSGAGLVGMRERAALLDGTFASGPEPAAAPPGGADSSGPPGAPGPAVWTVRAVLPLGAAEIPETTGEGEAK